MEVEETVETMPEGLEEIKTDSSNEDYETITMFPLQDTSGEITYVIVIQQDAEQGLHNNIQDQKPVLEDVYDFKDDENEMSTYNEDAKSNVSDKCENKFSLMNFACNICSYRTYRRYLLLRHMKSHSEVREHVCPLCERGFKSIASLQNHTNMHYGIKPNKCNHCKKSFTTSGELVRHVRYKHTKVKPHKCNQCDYASVELSKLRRHVRCHTGERPYQCPHCTYASADTFKLKRHLRTHTGEKPYKCDHCNLSFSQSNTLKSHKRIHKVGDKPSYPCALCPTTCGRMVDLRVHIKKLHTTTDRPIKCSKCEQIFSDRYSWKVHYETHKGEKSFKCAMCPYAATTVARLKTHMLTHTDKKPFVCDQCQRCFRQKQLLRRHQNMYHKPGYIPTPSKEKTYACQVCDRTFAYLGNLSRHILSHEPKPESAKEVLNPEQLEVFPDRMEGVIFSDPLDNVAFPYRFEDIENIYEQPKEVPTEVKEQMNSDDEKDSKTITLYDEESQSYYVIEVANYDDESETMIEDIREE